MTLPQSDYLDLETSPDGRWLTVWFNEPERRNPLTAARAEALLQLCEHLANTPTIRGVTFRGRGGVFCAGGDLKSFQAAFSGDDARRSIEALSRDGARLFDAVDTLPQFTIMAVEGAAMAGGFGLVCCGDCVVATAETRFALSETRIGLVAAQIAPFVQRRLGLAHTRTLMLTARTLTGAEAETIGLVDMCSKNDTALEETVASIRQTVSATAPGALSTTKALLRDLPHLDRHQQIDRAAADFADCLFSDEGMEGISAFLQKRKPAWAQPANEASKADE